MDKTGCGAVNARFGVLSTYPPTSCGLATFASALRRGLISAGAQEVGVVRCVEAPDDVMAPEVVSTWDVRSRASMIVAARSLDAYETVFLQHEYGIFGEDDGSAVLDLLDLVGCPVVTTLHTVPLEPSRRQRSILEGLVRRSDAVVAMTRAAGSRLEQNYDVDPSKVSIIPHGATRPKGSRAVPRRGSYVLTWGLLGPGKGIEWVVEALADDRLRGIGTDYLVVGRTHPKVFAREGHAYLDGVRRRVSELGLDSRVRFDETYHELEDLLAIIEGASCVVLPYESSDQITSGVLVDAVTAGKPVVATRFPHSVELLASGAGIVVDQRDSAGIADALVSMLADDVRYAAMAREAGRLAEMHSWPSVARSYMALSADVHQVDGAVA